MINPNEAPEGFVAVHSKRGCEGCSFIGDLPVCGSYKCLGPFRKDHEDVIFIPREKSKIDEFSAIGELAEARAEIASKNHAIDNLTIEIADLIKKNEKLENRVENQKGRIRYLEGATNHATGTPLSKANDEASRWKAACLDRDALIAKLKAQLTAALESIARMR